MIDDISKTEGISAANDWLAAVEKALSTAAGPDRAAALARSYAPGFPPAYRAGAGAGEAAIDIHMLDGLKDAEGKAIRLYRNPPDAASRLRLKLYSRDAVALSDVVPVFENFGFRVIGELATAVGEGDGAHIQRFLLELPAAVDADDVLARAEVVSATIAATMAKAAENDSLNALTITAGLAPRAVELLRALFRYLRQTGMPYGLETFTRALQRERAISGHLVALFEALHDPDAARREVSAAEAQKAIDERLEAVSAIDEDRILRLLRALVMATLRTNFFTVKDGEPLAFKFDSARIPGLAAPVPWREIWVYSPRVEGIHLRAGAVARGGLRWSDRRDDFRTEILGLMKAQRVKNAVIVPSGAKGGFYPKQLPDPGDRDAWLGEGRAAYRLFIEALLSVIDNVVADKVVHPAHMVIRDGEDPYFVVAADKGTATFSDLANAVALEKGFWLGDAFASGGSNGYDHKAMGITARGAWVGVRRHFAETGVNVQQDPVSVAGCGDMSGDVFGNGMLLSKAIRLVAAFDHRHIFLDPSPDPAASWRERERLFALPRSSWDEYDRSLLSAGGGVYSRTLKRIALSDEVRKMLGIAASELEPAALISAILRAPVDLLWFGGIGSYIKARSESHGDAGDPANDHLRVDAEEVRARVIGEGANLGLTHAARIAFALGGGRVNADFIDNSAGVDCSDNEVNIKIALNKAMGEGQLLPPARNALLAAMENDVASLVLEDNRLQALGLSVAETGGGAAVPSYIRLIELFEETGRIDRVVEGLGSSDLFLRRSLDGHGLTRPELATLFSTAKLTVQDAVEQGNLPDDPALDEELLRAFPRAMREWNEAALLAHPLRKQIIATKIANRMINRMGVLAPFELAEEEGCSLDEVVRAFVVAERLFDMAALWDAVDRAPVSEAARLVLFDEIATGLREHMADILRCLPAGLAPAQAFEMLARGVDKLTGPVDALLAGEALRRAAVVEERLVAAGAPADLAARVVLLAKLDGAVGLAQIASRLRVDEVEVATAFVRLGEMLGIDWVQATAARMEPADPWERLVVAGVARDLQHLRLDFLGMAAGKPIGRFIDEWEQANRRRIGQLLTMVQRARAAAAPNVPMLAKISSQAGILLRSGEGVAAGRDR